LVVGHCPLLAALQLIVFGFAAPTPEDMWTEGLRVQAPRSKQPRAEEEERQDGDNVRLHQKCE
jgi:hypothetical protein